MSSNPIDVRQAAEALQDVELVPCLEGPLASAKEMIAVCLAGGIPALLGSDPCCETGGCGPKAQVLVREDDLSKVALLLQERWAESLQREGLAGSLPALKAVPAEGEPPCPACGTQAPLAAGACSDCGLQLE